MRRVRGATFAPLHLSLPLLAPRRIRVRTEDRRQPSPRRMQFLSEQPDTDALSGGRSALQRLRHL
jgi:hypothetical protein